MDFSASSQSGSVMELEREDGHMGIASKDETLRPIQGLKWIWRNGYAPISAQVKFLVRQGKKVKVE